MKLMRTLTAVKPPATGEAAIQRALFAHIHARGVPNLVAFHPLNSGIHQRGRARAIHAGLGVLSGLPDVVCIHDGKIFGLELKTERGRIRASQRLTLDLLKAAGASVAVTRGLDAAIRQLERWGLLKGRIT